VVADGARIKQHVEILHCDDPNPSDILTAKSLKPAERFLSMATPYNGVIDNNDDDSIRKDNLTAHSAIEQPISTPLDD